MLDYTLLQFRSYVRQAQHRERRNLRHAVFAAAMGQAGAKTLQKVLEELDGP